MISLAFLPFALIILMFTMQLAYCKISKADIADIDELIEYEIEEEGFDTAEASYDVAEAAEGCLGINKSCTSSSQCCGRHGRPGKCKGSFVRAGAFGGKPWKAAHYTGSLACRK